MADNKQITNIIEYIKNFDIVFPITHGTGGEDGKLQGLLDFFNIKYVGCRCAESAICMDKVYSKMILERLNIPIVPFQILTNPNNLEISFPIIVKPANGGSSIGITKASNKEELITAFNIAKKYDNKVLAEKFIMAQELECAVLENKELIISEVGEINSANDFYDYNAKYENNSSKTIIPANVSDKIKSEIRDISRTVFNSLNLKGLARIDFLYDNIEKKLYLNEINTLPGFTTISMFPKLIMNQGYSYQEVITMLLENAK